MPESANIAHHLPLMAARQPDRPALKVPCGRLADGSIDYLSLTFAELDAEVDAWAARLAQAGVARGDRTLLMVKQGLPLIASAFALFKLGAVPIVIDPGMGIKNFLRCVARSRPRALVGIPLARLLSRVCLRAFSAVQIRVPASPSLTARLSSASVQNRPIGHFPLAEVAPEELAAVLFTSGSTGAPKGVCYEHGMLAAQVRLIREHYRIEPGEIDLPLLPVFALFNPALGVTTVVPEMDPRRPAQVDPAKIVQAIHQEGITTSFGSPTLWDKIRNHCLENKTTLPSLRRVLCAGAPVPARLWENPREWMPNGWLHSPYGATEALPVSSIRDDEVNGASVHGACVGPPLPGIEVRVVQITDGAIENMDDATELPAGEIGEILVRGPVVTKTYDARPKATREAKVRDGDTIWHRLGDCGYLDEEGHLWFCGRKVERVTTPMGPRFTEPCEQVFRTHARARRCALIGLGPLGRQQAALVVETAVAHSSEARKLARELRLLARVHPHTASIRTFYFRPDFPVDVRHNAKIHRLAIAKWATRAKGYESDPKR